MNKKLNNILISNDDGYESIGLELLLNIAEQLADNIFVVSPKKINQLNQNPLQLEKIFNLKKYPKISGLLMVRQLTV